MFGTPHNNWGPRPSSNSFSSSSLELTPGSHSNSTNSSVITGSIATLTSVQAQPKLNLYQYPVTNSNNQNQPVQYNQSATTHSTNSGNFPSHLGTSATQLQLRRDQAANYVQPKAAQVSAYQQPVNPPGVGVSSGVVSSGLPPWACQLHLLPQLYGQVVSYASLPTGQLDTSKLYTVLISSQLSKAVLGHLWSLVNKQTVGVLTVPECVSLLVLIALAQINRLPQPLSDISILHHLQVGVPNFPVPLLSLPPEIKGSLSSQTISCSFESAACQQKSSISSRALASSHFGGSQTVQTNSKAVTVASYGSSRGHLSTQTQQGVPRYPQPYYPQNVAAGYDENSFVSERSQYCGGCEACCAAEAIQSEIEEEEGGTLYIAEDLLYSGGSDSAESSQSSSSSSPSHGAFTDSSPKMNWNIPSNRISSHSTTNPSNARSTFPLVFPTVAEKSQIPPISSQATEIEDEFSGFESAVPNNLGSSSAVTPTNSAASFGAQSQFDAFRFNLGKITSVSQSKPEPKSNIEPSVCDTLGAGHDRAVIPQQGSDFGVKPILAANWSAENSREPHIDTSTAFGSTLEANFANFSLNITSQVKMKADDPDDDFADFQDFKSSELAGFADWPKDEKKEDFVPLVFGFQGTGNATAQKVTNNECSFVNKTAAVSAPVTPREPVADKYAAFRDLEVEFTRLEEKSPLDLEKSPSQDSQSTITSLQSFQSVPQSLSNDVIACTFKPLLVNPQTSSTLSSFNVNLADKVNDFTDFQCNNSTLQSAQKEEPPSFVTNKLSTKDFGPFADFGNVSSSNDEGNWADFSASTVFPITSTEFTQDTGSSFSGKIFVGTELLKDTGPIVSYSSNVEPKGVDESNWAQFSGPSSTPILNNTQPGASTDSLAAAEGFGDMNKVTIPETISQSETSIVKSHNQSGVIMTSQNDNVIVVNSQSEDTQIVKSLNVSVSIMRAQNEDAVVTSCEDEWADFEAADEEGEKSRQQVPDVSSLVWAKTQVSTDGFYDRVKQTILSEEVKKKPAMLVDKQPLTVGLSDNLLKEKTVAESKVEKLVTIPLVERYIGLDGASVKSDDSKQKEVWQKLLEQCREILSLALGALSPVLDNEKVQTELRGSSEWANFCCAAVLVYGVALRVMFSYRAANMNDDTVNDLIKSVDICWSQLKTFFPSEILQSEIFEIETKSQNVPAVAKFGAEACGVCLLRVDQSGMSHSTSQSVQTLPSTNHRNSCISYGGRQYHAPCANLWVNKVDLVLPALLVIDVL